MATCKECKLFDIEAAKDKAGRVQSDWLVKCLWKPSGDIPSSVASLLTWSKVLTRASYGSDCPCFQKRGTK